MIAKDTDPRVEICRTNLRLAVALRDTNYSEVARKTGMSRNILQQFIAGRTSISYANLLRICDVLDVPIGLLHRPDAISEQRIRLFRTLERMPDHLSARAVEAALSSARSLGESAT